LNNRYLSIAILILVVAGLAAFLSSEKSLLPQLMHVDMTLMVCLVILRFLFLVTNGLFLKTYSDRFGIRLSVKEWLGLSIVTTMGNFVTPFSGGLMARAAYLKHRHGFSYADFTTSLAANYLVNFWVISLTGIVVLLFLGTSSPGMLPLVLFFAAATAVTSLLAVVPVGELRGGSLLTKNLNQVLKGWTMIRKDRFFLEKLVLYVFVNIAINGLSFYLAYIALGSDVTFLASLVVSLLTSFSLLVNLTPGNLGIQEAVTSLSSALLGLGAGLGLLVALIIRAASLLPVVGLGPVFSYFLTKELAAGRPGVTDMGGHRSD
jgi:uncharacterized membrane protein YbhN (UPF0104 family)